jgi:DNA-directed RNA polymerase subunit RPC12/RpoP
MALLPSTTTAQCTNCGAPLEVPKKATEVACAYCGTKIRVERAQSAPPAHEAKPHTVYVKPGLPSFVIWFIVLTSVVPVIVPIALVVGPLLFGVVQTHVTGVTLPATCPPNGELELVGANYSGDGTVVTAEVNCKLRIKDSKLSGDVAVDAKANVEVTVENSTLEGKDVAIKLDVNSKANVTKGSVVKSPEVAVSGGTNAELSVDASRVEGGSRAVETTVNGKVRLGHEAVVESAEKAIVAELNLEITVDDSSVHGKDAAIDSGLNTKLKAVRQGRIAGDKVGVRASHNLKATLENAVVESLGPAICAGYNAELEATRSTIAGGGDALRFARKPEDLELSESQVRGAQNFDAENCLPTADPATTSAPPRAHPSLPEPSRRSIAAPAPR